MGSEIRPIFHGLILLPASVYLFVLFTATLAGDVLVQGQVSGDAIQPGVFVP